MTSDEIVEKLFGPSQATQFDPTTLEGLYQFTQILLPHSLGFDDDPDFPPASTLRLRIEKDSYFLAYKSDGGTKLGIRVPIEEPQYFPELGSEDNPGAWSLVPTATVSAETGTPCVDWGLKVKVSPFDSFGVSRGDKSRPGERLLRGPRFEELSYGPCGAVRLQRSASTGTVTFVEKIGP